MSRDDHRSIFDRPVHDHWDKMFDEDHDGWMTPSERAHKQAYLSRLSTDDSDDWDDNEDDEDWDDSDEKDEWDDEDDDEESEEF